MVRITAKAVRHHERLVELHARRDALDKTRQLEQLVIEKAPRRQARIGQGDVRDTIKDELWLDQRIFTEGAIWKHLDLDDATRIGVADVNPWLDHPGVVDVCVRGD